jgi:hypothetical protein
VGSHRTQQNVTEDQYQGYERAPGKEHEHKGKRDWKGMHANGITKTYMKSKVLAIHTSLKKNSLGAFCLLCM